MTSTMPGKFGGLTAVIDVSEFTLNDAAGTVPKLTPIAPVKWLPLTATEVPPADGPMLVPSPLTAGTEAGV